jgi:hypothetical protein
LAPLAKAEGADVTPEAAAEAECDASRELSATLRCSRLAPTSDAASEADSDPGVPSSLSFCEFEIEIKRK